MKRSANTQAAVHGGAVQSSIGTPDQRSRGICTIPSSKPVQHRFTPLIAGMLQLKDRAVAHRADILTTSQRCSSIKIPGAIEYQPGLRIGAIQTPMEFVQSTELPPALRIPVEFENRTAAWRPRKLTSEIASIKSGPVKIAVFVRDQRGHRNGTVPLFSKSVQDGLCRLRCRRTSESSQNH